MLKGRWLGHSGQCLGDGAFGREGLRNGGIIVRCGFWRGVIVNIGVMGGRQGLYISVSVYVPLDD